MTNSVLHLENVRIKKDVSNQVNRQMNCDTFNINRTMNAAEAQIQDMSKNLGQSYTELQIGGLGLANTIVRLHLTMDEQVTWDICENDPQGTVITLKGLLHDQSSHC